jgi:type II secretory pathway component PulK
VYNSISSEKGISLIEVMIAVMLVAVGIMALASLQGPAWNLTSRSDVLGRAGMILHRELETNELMLMNPNRPNPCVGGAPLVVNRPQVWAGGQGAAQLGDVAYNVLTTIIDNLNGSWFVRVQVMWPGNNVGISETVVVTRQEAFRF